MVENQGHNYRVLSAVARMRKSPSVGRERSFITQLQRWVLPGLLQEAVLDGEHLDQEYISEDIVNVFHDVFTTSLTKEGLSAAKQDRE